MTEDERTPDTQVLLSRAEQMIEALKKPGNMLDAKGIIRSLCNEVERLRDALAAQKDALVTAVPEHESVSKNLRRMIDMMAAGVEWTPETSLAFQFTAASALEIIENTAPLPGLFNAKPESEMEKP